MKNFTKISAVVFAAFAVCLAPLAPSYAQIELAVKVVGDRDIDIKRTQTGRETRRDFHETKALEITLRNRSAQSLDNVDVRYFLFADNVEVRGPDRVTIAKMESQSVALPPERIVTVNTDRVNFSYSPSRQGGTRSRPKIIPATGQRLAGWGVQVLVDGRVVAEKFEPVTMKEKAATAPMDTPRRPRRR
jgi:hypothetical protein